MLAHEIQAQGSGRQNVLQAQLPQRLMRLRQRGERLGPACWDINALQLLAEDAAMIAAACRTPENSHLAACLDALHQTVAELLHPPSLPGQAASARIANLIRTLAQQQPPENPEPHAEEAASITIAGATHELGFPLLVMAPHQYWTRFAKVTLPSPRNAGAAHVTAQPEQLPSAAASREAIPAQSSADRGPVGAAPTESAVVTNAGRTQEQLMRRVSECLAMEDSGIRAGGLLLFSLQDARTRRDEAGEGRYNDQMSEVSEFLISHVGRNDLVACAGEDGFLLLNPDCDPGLLEPYAFNLRDRIAREPFLDDPRARFLFDVGVCPFVAGATQADTMLDAARGAIGKARAAGRNGVSVVRKIEAAIDAGLVERIRGALKGDGFQLLFQPIVSLRGEEDEQFQVLLRLRDEDQRLHTAAELIPAAERAGLMIEVDRWVLERCVQLLSRRAPATRVPRLFVSQSLDSVRDPGSSEWLRQLLASDPIAADTLCVELSANDATRALTAVSRYAAAMKNTGVRLSLSGFEAGVLGERLLQALPADFIKVSPRYLRFDDALICSELRTLVERLQGDSKRVIAPRVEDARGAATLWAAGVDFIQGNFVQEAGADLAFDFQAALM